MSSLGFISLDELWGEDYNTKNYNEKTGVDYTGGNNFQTELTPVMNNNENMMLVENKNEEYGIVPKNQKQESQITKEEKSDLKDILTKIDDRIKKLEGIFLKREKQIVEGFSNRNGNYFDLLILVGLGILIIYVLDSVMKMGKKIKV